MQPFLINSHGRMVFPSNFLPQLDFSVIDDLDQLAAVIRRDFEAKGPPAQRSCGGSRRATTTPPGSSSRATSR